MGDVTVQLICPAILYSLPCTSAGKLYQVHCNWAICFIVQSSYFLLLHCHWVPEKPTIMIMLLFTIHIVQYVSYMHTKGKKRNSCSKSHIYNTQKSFYVDIQTFVISSITVITVILGPLSWGAHIYVVQTRADSWTWKV